MGQIAPLNSHRLSVLTLKPISIENTSEVKEPSSLERAYVETLCLNPRSIKRETYEFAVDRQSCKNALHIDSSFNAKQVQVMSRQASLRGWEINH